MKRKFLAVSLHLVRRAGRAGAIAILLFHVAGSSAQSRPSSFSADLIHVVGERSSLGKIFARDQGVRIESNQPGRQSVNIVRFDRKVM